MKLVIAGGCGDCGRNAFYIAGNGHAFILDCGVSTDGLNRIPDFTAEQLEKAEFLFLSHSHKDHSGAIEYVEDMGYTGPVLMSNRTYQQLSYKPKNTMILDSTAPELELLPDVRIKWGLTGHCAGSVWYLIQVGGQECLLFRGLPGRRCVLPLPAHTGHNRGSGHYGSSSGQGTVCAAYAPAGDGYPVFLYGRWKVCPSSGIPAWPGTVNRFGAGADSGI